MLEIVTFSLLVLFGLALLGSDSQKEPKEEIGVFDVRSALQVLFDVRQRDCARLGLAC